MNDYGKDRCYGGPTLKEIKAWRVKRRHEWISSLRRMHERKARRG